MILRQTSVKFMEDTKTMFTVRVQPIGPTQSLKCIVKLIILVCLLQQHPCQNCRPMEGKQCCAVEPIEGPTGFVWHITPSMSKGFVI